MHFLPYGIDAHLTDGHHGSGPRRGLVVVSLVGGVCRVVESSGQRPARVAFIDDHALPASKEAPAERPKVQADMKCSGPYVQ